VNVLKDAIEVANRDILRLNAQIRTHRGDKEIRMQEMASLIKSLSARGDIHTQLTAVMQDLQSEKLTVHHLRSEIDSYRLDFYRYIPLISDYLKYKGIIGN